MNRFRFSLLFTLFLLGANLLSAATFIVPTDAEFIDSANGIVRGVVVDSYVRRDALGRIETVYRFGVDEVLKGDITDPVIEIVQLGGILGNEFLVVSGSPAYRTGKSYVVFLAKNREDFWTTRDFTLGAFELVSAGGRSRYVRNMEDAGGWSRDGGPIVEPARDAEDFLHRIRARVRETRGAVIAQAIRPAALDLDLRGASTVGSASWTNDGASTVNYTVSPTPATGNAIGSDAEDRVIPDDPNSNIPGTFNGSGTVGTCFFGGFLQSNTDADGETYGSNITYADVVIQDGVVSANIGGPSNFNSVLAHEIGHSLGFRHSDRNASEGACVSDCSSSAIMTAAVTSGLNGALQAWDMDAVQKVYGTRAGGPNYLYLLGSNPGRRSDPTTAWRIVEAACTAVSISGHPQSTTIDSGQSTTLSVSASGTSPFTYQWYRGASGNTSDPVVGATSSSLNTGALTSTTSFWVRVTNCGGASTANSNAAVVTVTACTAPSITQQPFASPNSINPGGTATLFVSTSPSSGVSFQWYQGNPPTTTTPVGGNASSINVQPGTTTTYWVRVSRCSPPLNTDSQGVTVTVIPCNAPVISIEPQDASVIAGGSATLSVGASGTQPFTYQWYRGARGDTSSGVLGSSSSFNTGALSVTTQFWVRILNCGGQADSRAATISVTPCNPTVITTQPQNASVSTNGNTTLTVVATGTSLQYQWYRGQSGDQSNPISGAIGSAFNTGPLAATTSYWVKVTGCDRSVNSNTATVTVSSCAVNITTQPQNASGFGGTSVTLRVVATGTGSLSYQWYRGVSGQPSTPIAGATSSTYTTGPLTATTSYFVRVTSGAGTGSSCSLDSATATVTITVRRSRRPGKRR